MYGGGYGGPGAPMMLGAPMMQPGGGYPPQMRSQSMQLPPGRTMSAPGMPQPGRPMQMPMPMPGSVPSNPPMPGSYTAASPPMPGSLAASPVYGGPGSAVIPAGAGSFNVPPSRQVSKPQAPPQRMMSNPAVEAASSPRLSAGGSLRLASAPVELEPSPTVITTQASVPPQRVSIAAPVASISAASVASISASPVATLANMSIADLEAALAAKKAQVGAARRSASADAAGLNDMAMLNTDGLAEGDAVAFQDTNGLSGTITRGSVIHVGTSEPGRERVVSAMSGAGGVSPRSRVSTVTFTDTPQVQQIPQVVSTPRGRPRTVTQIVRQEPKRYAQAVAMDSSRRRVSILATPRHFEMREKFKDFQPAFRGGGLRGAMYQHPSPAIYRQGSV